GVLMVETLTQVATLLVLDGEGAAPTAPDARRVFLRGVQNAKFRRQVVPGDRLELEVTLRQRRGRLTRASGVASVGAQVVAEADLLISFEEGLEAAPKPIVHPSAVV